MCSSLFVWAQCYASYASPLCEHYAFFELPIVQASYRQALILILPHQPTFQDFLNEYPPHHSARDLLPWSSTRSITLYICGNVSNFSSIFLMILVNYVKHYLTNLLFIDHIARKNHLALIWHARSKLLVEGAALTKALLSLDIYRRRGRKIIVWIWCWPHS